MTSFSSLLSSLGGPAQAPQQSSTAQQKPAQPNNDIRKLTTATNGVKLTPNNTTAGVKRKSEEPEAGPRPKTAKPGQDNAGNKAPTAVASSRFQLSGKSGSTVKPAGGQRSATSRPGTASNPQKPTQRPPSRPTLKPAASSTPTPPSTANGAAPPKRGFASIMERAKAAQEEAKVKAASGIKHKPMETMSRKERLRMVEEAKTQQKSVKRRKRDHSDRSRSGTPVAPKAGLMETSFKGTMKKKAEPLAYKGTMRAVGPGEAKEKPRTKGQAQDKYGGYASWSDLDDAEDDEEEGYGSDGSSDMDAGWDDVEQEETRALRAAKVEDQKALEEEERHRKEKLERKRRLEELSKSAAGKKRY